MPFLTRTVNTLLYGVQSFPSFSYHQRPVLKKWPYLTRLPIELVLLVSEELSYSDRQSLALTCKSYHQALKNITKGRQEYDDAYEMCLEAWTSITTPQRQMHDSVTWRFFALEMHHSDNLLLDCLGNPYLTDDQFIACVDALYRVVDDIDGTCEDIIKTLYGFVACVFALKKYPDTDIQLEYPPSDETIRLNWRVAIIVTLAMYKLVYDTNVQVIQLQTCGQAYLHERSPQVFIDDYFSSTLNSLHIWDVIDQHVLYEALKAVTLHQGRVNKSLYE